MASLVLGLAASLGWRVSGPLVAVAAGAFAAAGMRHETYRTPALALALLAAGWWWGGVRLDRLDRSPLAGEVGRTALARLEVTGPARRGLFATRLPVHVKDFDGEPLSEPARLELPPKRAPPQGAVIEAVVRVVSPRGDEGGFDEAAYLRRQGVHVVLRADSYRVVGRRGGVGGVADRLRRHLVRAMAPGLSGERRAVVAGVVLGEDEGLDQELRDRFRASGLYHLLAVSGQNIAYVVAGVILLAWALGIPRWAAEIGALAAVGGYVLAVGWQPSVVRAGIAGALASLAWLASRPRDRWYFLLGGAAALLAWNPYSLREPGFQLSFAAVAAIFLFVPRLARSLEGYPVPRGLATVVAVSACCGVATAPILWLHFGTVPLYSVASNALAAPIVAPLLGLALGAAALEPLLPEAAASLAWVNGWLAAYLAGSARLVGGLPYAQASSLGALGAVAAVGGAVAVAFRVPSRRGRRLLALAGMVLALVAAWHMRPREAPPPPPTGLRITFLDVGQGDSVLVRVPEGAVLVDEGPPEAHVADQLRRLGVRRLAAVVLTHPQRDHIGGAAEVLAELGVGAVLDPPIPSESLDHKDALAEARQHGVRVLTVRAGAVFRLGKLRLRVLWPEGEAPPGEDPNRYAVVIVASYGAVDALLTADAESGVTLPLLPPRVEILKVAHHGSQDDGLRELLELVRPRVAVISVGEGNDYGHPTPSTLAVLDGFPGLAVYRTDEDGRVEIDSDGSRLTVRTER
jgi:competence protein ComEC